MHFSLVHRGNKFANPAKKPRRARVTQQPLPFMEFSLEKAPYDAIVPWQHGSANQRLCRTSKRAKSSRCIECIFLSHELLHWLAVGADIHLMQLAIGLCSSFTTLRMFSQLQRPDLLMRFLFVLN